MHAKAPGSIVWDEGEVERINRAQVALLLHKFPAEVDMQPVRDMADVLYIDKANKEIEAERVKQARKKHGKRR